MHVRSVAGGTTEAGEEAREDAASLASRRVCGRMRRRAVHPLAAPPEADRAAREEREQQRSERHPKA